MPNYIQASVIGGAGLQSQLLNKAVCVVWGKRSEQPQPFNAALGGNDSKRDPAFRGLLGRVDLLLIVVYRAAFFPPLFKVTKYFMNICRAKHSLPSPHQPSVTHSAFTAH